MMLHSNPLPFRQRTIDLLRQWPWIFPRGVEMSARDWIKRAQVAAGPYAGLRTDWHEEIHPDGVAEHALPRDLPEAARYSFNAVASRRYPAAAVCHFNGASLIGNEGLLVTRDNHVQAEFFHLFGTQSVSSSIYRRPFHLTTTDLRRLDAPVGLLAAPQGWNYYHWLFDVLPRLHLLQRWRDNIELYAVPANLSAVQLETLAFLGVDESRLLRLKPAGRIRCQHLYAPSLPGSEGCYPPWSLDFLRDTFLPKAAATAGQGPRIFIKRGPLAQRPVLNEPELIAKLEAHGFRAVSLENLSFLEQLAAFRDARLIVAAHGAGLSNLVFATGRHALLELYSTDYLRPDCFFTLSRRAGHTYELWLDGERRQPWGALVADLPAIELKISQLEQSLDGQA
jgi:capsular polysaccharide biosynthesis protein